MAFTPKAWANEKAGGTKLNAAALIDLEERVTDYADTGLVLNAKGSAYGAKGDGSTNDATAINAAITAVNEAGGGVVYFPRGTYVVSSTITLKEGVILQGDGPKASILKAGSSLNADVVKSANAGTTGANYCEVRNLGIDGNKANNATAGNGIYLDGQRTKAWNVEIHDCRENGFVHKKSATTIVNSLGSLDSGCYRVVSYRNEKAGFLIGGPTDYVLFNCYPIENKEDGIKSESTASALVPMFCHGFGTCERQFNFEGSFRAVGCQAEGATVTQVRCKTAGGSWKGGRIFRGGGNTNVPGFTIVANACRVNIDTEVSDSGTGGAFKFEESEAGSGSRIRAIVDTATTAITGTPSSTVDLDIRLRDTSIPGEKWPINSVSAASTITLQPLKYSRITGASEIKKINVTYPGHVIALYFESTAKLVEGENLKFASVTPGANGAVTLVCDGTNWHRAG